MYIHTYIYICIDMGGSVAILAQGRTLLEPWLKGCGSCAGWQSVIDILTQVCAVSSLAPHWHCFFMECLPTASVW